MIKPEILALHKAGQQEFAVIEKGVHYHRSSIQEVVHLRKSSVHKVVILSIEPKNLDSPTYTFSNYTQSIATGVSPFKTPAKSSKNVGLVVHDLDTGEVWVADYARFVGKYQEIMDKIEAYKNEEIRKEEERHEKVNKERELLALTRVKVQEQKNALIAQCKELFGSGSKFDVSMDQRIIWKNELAEVEIYGSVEIGYREFLMLSAKLASIKAGEQAW